MITALLVLITACDKLDRCMDDGNWWDEEAKKCYCHKGHENSSCEPYPGEAINDEGAADQPQEN